MTSMHTTPRMFAIFLIATSLSACDQQPNTQTPPPPSGSAVTVTPPPEPPPAPKEPSLLEELADIETASKALERVMPLMEDSSESMDLGTLALTVWSADRLKWTDVHVATDETSFGRIQKDSEQERGKRMCYSGQIVQISKTKLDSAVKPVYEGLLMTNGYKVINFIAAGSTGDLVAESRGRFCGIVTGTHSYSNSGGGTTHSVKMVGMFNLPENTL